MRRSTSSKGGSAAVVANLSQNDDSKVEVGAEYTKRDVKALEADELELIVRLLKLKGDALTRVTRYLYLLHSWYVLCAHL